VLLPLFKGPEISGVCQNLNLVIKIFRGIMPKVLAYFKRAKGFRKFYAKMCLINIALKL